MTAPLCQANQLTARIPSTAASPTTTTVPGGPVGRWLTDPDAPLHTAAEWLHHNLLAVVAVTALAAAAVAAVVWVRRQATAHATEGGRILRVETPPDVESASAAAFWANLHGLLSSHRSGLFTPLPHVGFELRFHDGTVDVCLWVPESVPAVAVARAVEAAWPAARTTLLETTTIDSGSDTDGDADPPGRAGGSMVGSRLRLAAPAWRPLQIDHDADPLRGVLGAAATSTAGETVLVQVLARPARPRDARRLRARAAAALGVDRRHRRRSSPGTQTSEWRAATAKAQELLWHVEIRCTTTDASIRHHEETHA